LEVRFWGTRGSIPSPGPETIKFGGNTTCVEVILDDGTIFVFDAGTGIKKLGQHIVRQRKSGTIHLFFTHSHWDHIQGFPLFEPAYSRDFNIKIYCCPTVYQKLQHILITQMDSRYFPVKFSQLQSRITFHELIANRMTINNANLICIENNHPGGANGFRVDENNRSVVFITDNELMPKGNSGTQWKDFVKFCQKADLLIHDAHYLPQEMNNTIGYGHSSYDQALQLAKDAEVNYLLFFHHEPDRTDQQIEKIVDDYRQKIKKFDYNLKLDAAIEGSSYRI